MVLSSRVRLARNLGEYPFPWKLNSDKQKEVVEKIDAVFRNKSTEKEIGKLRTVWLKDLPDIQRKVFVEKHVISPQHADVSGNTAKAVILRDDDVIAIMMNEEDHLRIQVLLPGLQLEQSLTWLQRWTMPLRTLCPMPLMRSLVILPHVLQMQERVLEHL